ncbi:hypothetical protein [Limnobacter sp.]|uniref:hypothetical protein n=1 Tax=Limnobacter sp. TaxID=2003368 RepID=UPI003749A644
MPTNLLTVPDGSLTDKPWHFSVKNMAPLGKNAISQGFSNLVKTVVEVRLGAAAIAAPPTTKLAEAKTAQDKSLSSFFILSPDFVIKTDAQFDGETINQSHPFKIAQIESYTYSTLGQYGLTRSQSLRFRRRAF